MGPLDATLKLICEKAGTLSLPEHEGGGVGPCAGPSSAYTDFESGPAAVAGIPPSKFSLVGGAPQLSCGALPASRVLPRVAFPAPRCYLLVLRKKNMTTKTDDTESYARSYIDAALEAQRRLGEPVNISRDEYENAVRSAASAFEDLARVRKSRRHEAVASN